MRGLAIRRGAAWFFSVLVLAGVTPHRILAAPVDPVTLTAPSAEADESQAAEGDEECDDTEGLPTPGCSELDLALMGLVLMIGHVPEVELGSTGSEHDPVRLPGGTDLPPVIDSATPSQTPEPAGWILGMIGCAAAGAGAWVRRRHVQVVAV
jgi:hypothetical protein